MKSKTLTMNQSFGLFGSFGRKILFFGFSPIFVVFFISLQMQSFAQENVVGADAPSFNHIPMLPSLSQVTQLAKEGHKDQIEQCFVAGMNSDDAKDWERAYVCGSVMVKMGSRDPKVNQEWLDDHFRNLLKKNEFDAAKTETREVFNELNQQKNG